MTATVSKFNDPEAIARKSVVSPHLSSTGSLKRENRWKRRRQYSWVNLFALAIGCLFIGFLAASIFAPKAKTTLHGLETPFAKAVYAAFPEADPAKIVTVHDGDLPLMATLHLPAHLIEPEQGIGNPFARLGGEFGGDERTLPGAEMASRLEQIGHASLPADVPRCHSYDIGEISSKPKDPRQTRILRLHLNPGC